MKISSEPVYLFTSIQFTAPVHRHKAEAMAIFHFTVHHSATKSEFARVDQRNKSNCISSDQSIVRNETIDSASRQRQATTTRVKRGGEESEKQSKRRNMVVIYFYYCTYFYPFALSAPADSLFARRARMSRSLIPSVAAFTSALDYTREQSGPRLTRQWPSDYVICA